MRRLAIVMIAILATIGLLGTGAVAFRKPLTEWLATAYLGDRGYPNARLTIGAFTAEELEILDISLGPEVPLRVDLAAIAYDPRRLLSGETSGMSITVEGARGELDFTQPEDPLAPFSGLLGAGMPKADSRDAAPVSTPSDKDAPPTHLLPMMTLRDARLALRLHSGRATVAFDGTLAPAGAAGELPTIRAEGSVESDDVPLEGNFSASIGQQVLDVTAHVIGEKGLDATFRVEAETQAKPLNVEIVADVILPAGETFAWQVLGLPPAQSGRARLHLSGSGGLKDLTIPRDIEEVLARLDWGGWQARAGISVENLTSERYVRDLAAKAVADFRVIENSVHITPVEPWTLQCESVSQTLLDRWNLPRDSRTYLERPMEVSFITDSGSDLVFEVNKTPQYAVLTGTPVVDASWPESSARLTARSDIRAAITFAGRLERIEINEIAATIENASFGPAKEISVAIDGRAAGALDRWTGDLRAEITVGETTLPGYRFTQLEAVLPIALEWRDTVRRISLSDAGSLRVGGCRVPGLPRVGCPIGAELSMMAVNLGETPGYSARAQVSGFNIVLPRTDETPIDIAIGSIRLDVDGPLSGDVLPERARLSDFSIVLSEYDLAAQGIELELRPRDDQEFARLRLSQLEHQGEPSYLAPMTLQADVKRTAEGYSFDAEGNLGDTGALLRSGGRLTAAGDAGDAQLTVPRIAFAPSGLQPADLAPVLSILQDVAGAARMEATASWGPDGVDGEAEIDIQDLDFETNGIAVSGLRGTLRLADLLPLRAAPGQSFQIREIDAGLPIRDAVASFAIHTGPQQRPVLHVQEASGEMLGGLLRVEDWTFDPVAERQEVTLRIDSVQLSKIFESIDIEGLNGTGAISGTLPVVLENGGVAIAEGSLAAEQEGSLSFESPGAEQALASSGEQVELMLRALKDFQYESLDMALSKPIDGAAMLRISLLGHNPDVLDGYPFQFNITLSGDIEPLLSAIAKGQRLSSELLQRSLKLR